MRWPGMWFAALAALFVILGASTLGTVGCQLAGTDSRDAPLAVVSMGGPDRLLAVNLDTGGIVHEVRLRSMAGFFAIDPVTGIAVTPQMGGAGSDADHVAGLWDVRRGGPVRYVDLKVPNPDGVAIDHGQAYVIHGWIEKEGAYTDVVDIASGSVVRTGHVPDGIGRLWTAGGGMWTTAFGPNPTESPDDTQAVLLAVDPATFKTRRVFQHAKWINAVLSGEGQLYAVGQGAPSARIVAFDPGSGRWLRDVRVPGFASGLSAACRVGRLIALADGGDLDPGAVSGTVTLVDAVSLKVVRRIVVPGGVGSIAASGEKLVVVRCDGSTLRVYDPATGRSEREVRLGPGEAVVVYVQVLQRGQGYLTVASAQPE